MSDRSKPQRRTRVLLDESEIQRRLARPRKPTLAERYATESQRTRQNRSFGIERTRPDQASNALRFAETIWLTRPILHARGWTDTAISDFLPQPERHRKVPRRRGQARVPQWSAGTVARAEATAAWRHWLKDSLKRRNLTEEDLDAMARGDAFRHRILEAEAAITAYQNNRASNPDPPRQRRT
ncbi:hypothetical protein [Glycomyces sp. NRRL B-16210]|uniref:hypothetical protein n=1 Tax=Glycomyces sp. NRRL B-16210 TaxID=1463821 RepID=UPI0010616A56|nr:hypothetical protein [Glycomyces sp. NRRL B-16210]